MSYSFERIAKLLEERELGLQRYAQAADKSWSLTGEDPGVKNDARGTRQTTAAPTL